MPTLHHRAFHKARVNLVEFSEIFSLSEMRADASSPYKALTKKKTSKTPYALIRRNLFHLSTLKRSKTMKATGAWIAFALKYNKITRPSAILERCSNLDWNRWHVTLFTSQFSKVSVFTRPL